MSHDRVNETLICYICSYQNIPTGTGKYSVLMHTKGQSILVLFQNHFVKNLTYLYPVLATNVL